MTTLGLREIYRGGGGRRQTFQTKNAIPCACPTVLWNAKVMFAKTYVIFNFRAFYRERPSISHILIQKILSLSSETTMAAHRDHFAHRIPQIVLRN